MATSPARLLREFHERFDLHRQDRSGDPPPQVAQVRQRLLDEEVAELADAVHSGDLARVAHELADVHRANLSKSDAHGKPVRRDDGKVLRSDRYQPPDVAAVLRHQGWRSPE